jgi:hypothetical protein
VWRSDRVRAPARQRPNRRLLRLRRRRGPACEGRRGGPGWLSSKRQPCAFVAAEQLPERQRTGPPMAGSESAGSRTVPDDALKFAACLEPIPSRR